MRNIKFIVAAVSLLLAGAIGYAIYSASIPWEDSIRRQSVRILSAATTSNELQAAVGQYGVLLTLSNGSWIAIRHREMFEPSRALAIARDSDGKWFESRRQFSGGLTYYPLSKLPGTSTRPRQLTPECFELERVASSPTLNEARAELLKMNFTPLQR
jgi:hypothetical protein